MPYRVPCLHADAARQGRPSRKVDANTPTLMRARTHKKKKKMPSTMPLEELGLLCLLERVGSSGGEVDGYARYGLLHRGLITDGEPPKLTQAGVTRLTELRRQRDSFKAP